MNRRRNILVASLAALLLAVVPTALAAKGGNGGGKNATPATGTLKLVLSDSNGNGVANWGESVTFDVSTTASYPSVTLTCYQNGDWVTNQTVGFYGYMGALDFPLSSWKWTGGAAECTATLWIQDTRGSATTLDSYSFHVDA